MYLLIFLFVCVWGEKIKCKILDFYDTHKNISVIDFFSANAYLIYKQVNRLNRHKLSKLQFWTSVCTELIGECRNPNNERGRPSMSAIPLRMTGKHYPYFWQGVLVFFLFINNIIV